MNRGRKFLWVAVILTTVFVGSALVANAFATLTTISVFCDHVEGSGTSDAPYVTLYAYDGATGFHAILPVTNGAWSGSVSFPAHAAGTLFYIKGWGTLAPYTNFGDPGYFDEGPLFEGFYNCEGTPEVTPEVTPDVTPEVTPEVSPEVTPEVTPDVTPEVTPEVSPEVTPEVTPDVTGTETPVSPVALVVTCKNQLPIDSVVYNVPAGAPAYFNPDLQSGANFNLPAGTWKISEFRNDFAKVWIACGATPIWIPRSAVGDAVG
jgi:hypothetical protein